MIKGFWLAFYAAWEVLPQNHPLRPRIVACVREIADDLELPGSFEVDPATGKPIEESPETPPSRVASEDGHRQD